MLEKSVYDTASTTWRTRPARGLPTGLSFSRLQLHGRCLSYFLSRQLSIDTVLGSSSGSSAISNDGPRLFKYRQSWIA